MRVRHHASVARRVEMPPLDFADDDVELSVADLLVASQGLRQRLQERATVGGRQRLGSAQDGIELGIGQSEHLRHVGEPPRRASGIRDLASLSKTLARNHKSSARAGATKPGG